ncbi:MAG: hypothetical protein DLM70_03550, partial [Chloroflexi bacterium]
MIEGLSRVLEGSTEPGLTELRDGLQDLLGGDGGLGRLVDQQRLQWHVYRLWFEVEGRSVSLVVKGSGWDIARRNELAARRWLPGVGLDRSGPPLVAVAVERHGERVWHVYEDLGDAKLSGSVADRERVAVAMEALALIHARFVRHPLLAECRLWGGDRGMHLYTSSVRDAITALESLEGSSLADGEITAARESLLQRLYTLLHEEVDRARLMADLGGPETLLHGDPWLSNIFGGFAAACNRGAAHAGSDILVFLDPGVLPLPGLVPALVRTFRDYPQAAVVGAKMISAEGRLEEAGGVVLADGSRTGLSDGDREVSDPAYTCVRQVDYASRALFATRR